MPKTEFLHTIETALHDLRARGLYKTERRITSPQSARIRANGREVINLCANNYLGLANHPAAITAAKRGLDRYGFGLSSVRFICGTQDVHVELEATLSRFLGTDDTILFSSCFDANGGVFEALFGEEDAIVSDALNHASIIDGIRLSKAKRYRYANGDMNELQARLEEARGARQTVIVTDGVFSMDGVYANLPAICDLADRYGALVMVDDSHAVGFTGPGGRGTHELQGVMGRIDLLSGTLGKALGGASGGYIAGRRPLVEWLRQRARPYLFSNTLAPAIAAASLEILRLVESASDLRERLARNSVFFREEMAKLGFRLIPGSHPIIPVMLGDARVAQSLAEELFAEGVYVVGFSYPVVPEGQARIRTQMSAAHSQEDLRVVVHAFEKCGKKLGIIR